MANQSYGYQLSALNELAGFLGQLQVQIEDVVNQYPARLQGLRERGLPEEVYRRFEMDFGGRVESIKGTIQAITEQGRSVVAHNIQSLEQAANG